MRQDLRFRFVVKSRRNLDRQRAEHGQAARDRHQVRVCSLASTNGECIAWHGRHGKRGPQERHVATTNQLPVLT